jgi:hypothetical protein
MTDPVKEPMQVPERRIATSGEIADTKEMLVKVRKVIAKFHKVRRQNNERASGLRPAMFPAEQVQQIIQMQRDPQMEARAVAALRELISIVRGHEPNDHEIKIGLPEGFEQNFGMGVWPAVIAVALLSSGASVYSYFSYLTATEETIQMQSATPFERLTNAIGSNLWAIAALGGAVAVGYYIYHRRQVLQEREREQYMRQLGPVSRPRIPARLKKEKKEEKKEKNRRRTYRRRNPKKRSTKNINKMVKSLSRKEQKKMLKALDNNLIKTSKHK